jgi:deoxyribose-phosphate aldolase
VGSDARTIALRCLALLDLGAGGPFDDVAVRTLCGRARSPFGPVAAVSVPLRHVAAARERVAGSGVRVAVLLPPSTDVPRTTASVEEAVIAGADEIELVYPYPALIAGDRASGTTLIRACREASRRKTARRPFLKVTLETGQLRDLALVRQAAEDAIEAGADMLTTASGAVQPATTLLAAKAVIEAIKAARLRRLWIGLKVGGDMRALAEIEPYLALAERMLGSEFLSPATFRLGGAGLYDDIARTLGAKG